MPTGIGTALIGGAIAGGSALYGAHRADQAGDKAAAAAQYAAYQQQQGIKRGIKESAPFYEASQNYLSPYVTGGATNQKLLDDITGINGPDRQRTAYAMFQNSPLMQVMADAEAKSVRDTLGEHAAMGLRNSGAATEAVARRLADMRLGAYNQWQSVPLAMFGTGANAAGAAASGALSRGRDILDARAKIGTAGASGTIGAANAQLAGGLAGNNYLMNAAGRAAGTDWSRLFSGFGGGSSGGTGMFQDFGGSGYGLNFGGR